MVVSTILKVVVEFVPARVLSVFTTGIQSVVLGLQLTMLGKRALDVNNNKKF